MEVSNYYSTAKLWGTSDKKVSKSSEKNKWKLTDSLKEKIVDLAKKDAQDNVYMGNAFMNLRKAEVSKVAPDRATLIGKFSQSMNSGNMSALKMTYYEAFCDARKALNSEQRTGSMNENIMSQGNFDMKA